MDKLPQQDLRAASELSAFFIAAPKKGSIANMFSTHPPMEQRIEKLMEYERQLQTGTLAAA
jgi:heat shock protein HtpX